jgi:hypothetical protein
MVLVGRILEDEFFKAPFLEVPFNVEFTSFVNYIDLSITKHLLHIEQHSYVVPAKFTPYLVAYSLNLFIRHFDSLMVKERVS